jgi:hypothetical protein
MTLSLQSKEAVLNQVSAIVLAGELQSATGYSTALQFAETLDYAGKKGGKGKKNCEKGKICKGSCIAKAKNCLGDMNPAQLKAHKAAQKSAKKAKGGGGGDATPDVVPVVKPIVPPVAKPIAKDDIPDAMKEPIAAKVLPKKDAIDDLLDETPDVPKTKAEELAQKAKSFLADASEPNVAAKIDRIRTEFPEMTRAEAHAIATWIGAEETFFAVKGESINNYKAMNMAYYNPKGLPSKQLEAVQSTNQLLESAYKKLPSPSIGYIQEKALGKKPPVIFDPENNLTRNLEFTTPAQTKAYLQKYRDSIGKEVTENYHLAATHLPKLDWAEKDANVQLNIKPRYGEN